MEMFGYRYKTLPKKAQKNISQKGVEQSHIQKIPIPWNENETIFVKFSTSTKVLKIDVLDTNCFRSGMRTMEWEFDLKVHSLIGITNFASIFVSQPIRRISKRMSCFRHEVS